MEVFLCIIIAILLFIIVALLLILTRKIVGDIQKITDGIPKSVLDSITKSIAQRTGKFYELLALLKLKEYDRLFHLGELVDYVGVKFGESVDFIEVKTGKAVLNEDEKQLKELIDAKKVNYIPIRAEKIGMAENIE